MFLSGWSSILFISKNLKKYIKHSDHLHSISSVDFFPVCTLIFNCMDFMHMGYAFTFEYVLGI